MESTLYVRELDRDELMEVEGGSPWAVIVAAASFAYKAGKDIGAELYHLICD